MSFIPSFILSAIVFFNANVAGGWDDAGFSEGFIGELPYTSVTLSADEKADERPALRNAAVIFKLPSLSLKLAAGNLTVTGAGGSGALSATLPGKDDASKPPALFISWKDLSLLTKDNRMLVQLSSSFSGILCSNALTACWTRIEQTKDDSWFLRYPWHKGGNLHILSDSLSARLPLFNASLETTATVSLSIPDMLAPNAGGTLDLLLKAGSTETTLAFSAAPARFMTANGSFTPETLSLSAGFLYAKEKENEASTSFKATAAFVQKQPEKARELSRQLAATGLSCAFRKKSFSLGMTVQAEKISPQEGLYNAELSPQLELAFSGTELSAKGTFLPFMDTSDDTYTLPAWSVKAGRNIKELMVFYQAEFSGSSLETQDFSVAFNKGQFSLSSEIVIKKAGLTWNLSVSKSW